MSAGSTWVERRSRLDPTRSPRTAWVVSFALLLLLALSWGLASPVFSVPDEASHVIKAAAVSRGQLLGHRIETKGGTITVVRVPEMFGKGHDLPRCYAFKAEVTADCAPPFAGSTKEAEVGTTAGNYLPVYYLLVGLPSLVAHPSTAVYLMRLLSAALSSAFLASALVSALEWRRSRLLVVGVLLSATPMVLFLAGSVNPNSLEISAAVCLWVSGVVLAAGGGTGGDGRLLARIGLSASTLVLMRGLSPLWLAVVAVVLAAVTGRRRLATLLGRRDARRWLAVVVTCSAFAVAWILLVGTLDLLRTDEFRDLPLSQAVRMSMGKTDYEIRQMVGVFGGLDTFSPSLTYYLWFSALGFVLLLGLAVSPLRLALALLGVLAVTVFLPVALESSRVEEYGFPWQGRYILPLAVGLPVLAAFAVARRPEVLAGHDGRVAVVLAVSVAVAHVASFAQALRRYTVGANGTLVFFDGRWDPPVPTAALVAGFTLAVAAFAAWCWHLMSTPPALVVAAAPLDAPPRPQLDEDGSATQP